MIRAFKNLEEFKEKTGLGVGYTVSVRLSQDVFPPEFYLHDGMITGFDYGDKTVCIGSRTYSLETLSKFEYLKDGKWIPFGVEEVSTRPAKFKVGKKYYCLDDYGERTAVFVTAKYKDPLDGKLKVVFDNRVCEVKTDEYDEEGEEDNNEFLSEDFLSDVIDARDEVKE